MLASSRHDARPLSFTRVAPLDVALLPARTRSDDFSRGRCVAVLARRSRGRRRRRRRAPCLRTRRPRIALDVEPTRRRRSLSDTTARNVRASAPLISRIFRFGRCGRRAPDYKRLTATNAPFKGTGRRLSTHLRRAQACSSSTTACGPGDPCDVRFDPRRMAGSLLARLRETFSPPCRLLLRLARSFYASRRLSTILASFAGCPEGLAPRAPGRRAELQDERAPLTRALRAAAVADCAARAVTFENDVR